MFGSFPGWVEKSDAWHRGSVVLECLALKLGHSCRRLERMLEHSYALECGAPDNRLLLRFWRRINLYCPTTRRRRAGAGNLSYPRGAQK